MQPKFQKRRPQSSKIVHVNNITKNITQKGDPQMEQRYYSKIVDSLPNLLQLKQMQQNRSQVQTALKKFQFNFADTLNEFMIQMNKKKSIYHQQKPFERTYLQNQRKMQSFQKKLFEGLELQEQSQYKKMRDSLANYIRKVNKAIFEVQIEQQIQQKKLLDKKLQERQRQTEVLLASMNQFYGDQKLLLTQHLREKREEADVLEKR